MTPTGRSLVYLRRLGFTAAVVERWLPRVQLRQDLFGVADVLAFHPRDRLFLLVQVTTAGHVAHRLAKAKGRPELAASCRPTTILPTSWSMVPTPGPGRCATAAPTR